ncbi:MAG: phosphonate C-P lyase system protein PhnH [ANME-2 cluster archaeon]|nr:phosphonate C-P lyase system protein PhnH [ANME-2 cluster archaeon]
MRETAFDVTFDSQMIFRSLLDAMARPGSIVVLPDINITSPAMNRYPLLLLMTLLDHEVSFCVLGHSDANVNVNINQQAVAEYLRSNTGSNESALRDADFILVCEGSSQGLIRRVKLGTLEYPDESATVVYDVCSIGDRGYDGDDLHDEYMLLELSGPGIAGKCMVAISGMEQAEIEDVLAMRDYPLGIDAILSDRDGKMACIPRSTSLRVM